MDENTKLESGDFRNILPRFTPQAGKRTRRSWICWEKSANGKQRRRHKLPAAIQLEASDLSEIENAAAKIQVQGTRYPENIEKMTGL